MENYSRTRLLNDLQRLFNTYIRKRDHGKPCIYCLKPISRTGLHVATAGHYIPVSIAGGLRFDTDNVHLAGGDCNVKDDRVAYRRNLVARIGEDRVLVLEARQHSLAKMTTFEIREKITFFKKLLKAY